METQVCQRWQGGRASWRAAREPFDPKAFEVGPVDRATARAFVVREHGGRS